MNKKLLTLACLVSILGFLTTSKQTLASEGLVELTNRVGEDSRCFAASVLMEDLKYTVIVSCRDILYPGGTDIFRYTMWAVPVDGSSPQRLGDIDLGKVQFRTQKPFATLFVTKERQSQAKQPSDNLVMQGSVQPIELLESGTPTVTPESELGEPEVSPTPKPKSGFNILRVGGAIGFVALFATILLVFFLTRR